MLFLPLFCSFLSMWRPSAVSRVSWTPSSPKATRRLCRRSAGDTASWWTASAPWPRTAVPTMARWESEKDRWGESLSRPECHNDANAANKSSDATWRPFGRTLASSCHGNSQSSLLPLSARSFVCLHPFQKRRSLCLSLRLYAKARLDPFHFSTLSVGLFPSRWMGIGILGKKRSSLKAH